jgi:hypothetical protein
VPFPSPPVETKSRHSKLSEHGSSSSFFKSPLTAPDSFLHAILSTLDSYTVIYTSTPPSAPLPPPIFEEVHELLNLHVDLKRDLSDHETVGITASGAPIFAKYVFLSPALFMVAFVVLLLFGLFYVGISALLSLQVSYFAFSKEMGPAAQKKNQ